MIPIASIPPAFLLLDTSDRSVSSDGKKLNELLRKAREPDTSIVLGARWRALDLACAEAAFPGWDGEGSAPTTPAVCEQAKRFLEALPPAYPDPEIWVDRDGDVVFEWASSADWVFVVVLDGAGILRYSGLFGEAKAYGRERFGSEVPGVVGEHLARFAPQLAAA